MAEFQPAFDGTTRIEGGHVDDSQDSGGETYMGISRKWNPNWVGWAIIDAQKNLPNFPASLATIVGLYDKVKAFYRSDYWEVLKGDQIPSQAVAEELFDTAVNVSKKTAVEFLQDALNALNRNGATYDDIAVDGGMGPVTIKALSSYLEDDQDDLLLAVMNGLQLSYYIDAMRRNPVKEKYARGWIRNRVMIAHG